MNRWFKIGTQATMVAIAGLMIVSSTAFAQAATGGGPGTPGDGRATTAPASTPLTAAEVEALQYMREEEKLARDVYTALYAQWGLATFQNISQSEQTHMQAIKTLLDRYGVVDPTQAQAGRFTNPVLQKLYNELLARGQKSLGEALKVGAAIEEIDIRDLQARQAQSTHADLQQVFSNLERGSNNHLRAFVSALAAQTGETYAPQSLSPEAYRAIVNGSNTRGYGDSSGTGTDSSRGTNLMQNRGPRWKITP